MIKREQYLRKIRPFYDSELVKVLIGIRRCGKSVILKQIMDELLKNGIDEERIIYLNFEDLEFSDLLTAKNIHQYIKDQRIDDEKHYLLFDEIQNVVEFEKAINSFRATWNVSIFITGSNSNILSGELATLLSGRYVSFKIHPFSFKEVCVLKQLNRDSITDEIVLDFVTWGSMPQKYYFSKEEEVRTLLEDLFNTIVLKDIMGRSKIRDTHTLNRLIEYMMQNPSQVFSVTSISKYFESINRKVSNDALYNYLEAMLSAMLISKAVRYDIRGKKILTRQDKYYLMDNGLGRIKNSGFKVEIGALLENVVYNELCIRGYNVYVGMLKQGEIDFVAVKDEKIEYYQVAYLLATDEVVKREFGAFKTIRDNFPKYVISMDKFDFSRDGIVHKNLVEFLLEY